ncbi:MAG: hypothetical protein ACLT2T_06845 [Bilophila wadsworthia]
MFQPLTLAMGLSARTTTEVQSAASLLACAMMEVPAQVAEHGGQGAHGGETPFPGGQGVEDVRAGVEQFHLDVEPGFLVPALFLGVPHQEGSCSSSHAVGTLTRSAGEGAAYGQVQHAKGRGHAQKALPHKELLVHGGRFPFAGRPFFGKRVVSR